MALINFASRILGMVVGIALVGGALVAVMFLKKDAPAEAQEAAVRPLKMIEVGKVYRRPVIAMPGRVSAGEKALIAFEVSGQLVELPVRKGDAVKAGDLIAAIDPRDFQNSLDAAKAKRERAKAQLDRMTIALKANAVSQQDFDDAMATWEVAVAEEKTRAKALDDTKIYAKFDGVIAERFVQNFENISSKQQIVALQNLDRVEIVVSVPQQRVTKARAELRDRIYATFDNIPGRQFDLTLKEFATEADPLTQTFSVTLVMDSPEDVNIWPGMTGTVHAELMAPAEVGESRFMVPLSATAIDGSGRYYVWKLQSAGEGVYEARRADVKVDQLAGEEAVVSSGLSRGDLIAAAGVTLLNEGQRVRRFDPAHAAENAQ